MADLHPQPSEKDVSLPSTPEKKVLVGDVATNGELHLPMVLKNGIRLHPQPTSDPLDPLNWTSFRKHTILAVVMAL